MSPRLFRLMTFGMPLAMTGMILICATSCNSGPQPGTVLDEAMAAQRNAATLPAADEDYYHDMDRMVPNQPLQLSPNEVKGRNTWIVWTAGNDRFWDTISVSSFGALDFLKTLSSHPSQLYSRDTRWKYLGLVN